jgi:hypothetical protein
MGAESLRQSDSSSNESQDYSCLKDSLYQNWFCDGTGQFTTSWRYDVDDHEEHRDDSDSYDDAYDEEENDDNKEHDTEEECVWYEEVKKKDECSLPNIELNGNFLRFRRGGVSISYTVICLSHFDVCLAITYIMQAMEII